MTYNVHGGVGTDGVLDLSRIARVIHANTPHVVALQECDVGRPRSGRAHQPELLARALGYGLHFTAARDCEPGEYGNAVLTSWPFDVRSEGILPCAAGERRAVQWLRIKAPLETFDLLNTHLSLNARERWLQVAALLSAEWLAHVDRSDATVVCGDFNMAGWSRVYRRLLHDLCDAQRICGRPRCTFPSAAPFLRLDHVLVSRRAQVLSCHVPRDRLARVASDHLPLIVELELGPRGALHGT